MHFDFWHRWVRFLTDYDGLLCEILKWSHFYYLGNVRDWMSIRNTMHTYQVLVKKFKKTFPTYIYCRKTSAPFSYQFEQSHKIYWHLAKYSRTFSTFDIFTYQFENSLILTWNRRRKWADIWTNSFCAVIDSLAEIIDSWTTNLTVLQLQIDNNRDHVDIWHIDWVWQNDCQVA